ncbi:unnamed protein product [Zymoseptoria tritici ST99CH_3D1]|uniref:Uncharacterized protein n=2 Tax=Zymoseptoria tritici TaxID=1047171 RepID=F9XS36_ZYMTI|nr:uncharacterized protein MYCGRDRAFT_98025 [Zymoseptoria tritici IPO323]EGP81899.1 hypothetical protein MYCGRDRAFT_98025 [Zymoseptoria tritici IPO323]SMR62623.1 unnamed protein product [Zymoseptoria tritici ST99CH_1E4]SMR65127.1 unnamed protein product [Zymoseptoria tritici ST99CH_3D1]
MIQERPVTQIVNLHSIVVRIQPTTRNGEHEKEHEKDHDKEHRKEACWTRSMHLDGFRGVHARCGCLCLMILANQTPTSNAPWLAIEDADRRCEEDHITTQFQLEDNCGDNADTPVPNHDQSTSIEAQHIGSIVNKLEDNRGNNTDTAIHEQCFLKDLMLRFMPNAELESLLPHSICTSSKRVCATPAWLQMFVMQYNNGKYGRKS